MCVCVCVPTLRASVLVCILKQEAATLGLTPTSRVNVVGEAELTEVLRINEDTVQSLWSPQWGGVSTVGDAVQLLWDIRRLRIIM